MSTTQSTKRSLVTDRRAEVGRRRVAPKAIETSDVTRFRGLLFASGAAIVILLAGLVAMWATGHEVTPSSTRALSRPHRDANLECASCHAQGFDRRAAAATCQGCHGEHTSRRAGHAALAQAGKLECITCHPTHGADGGVRFTADGAAIRYAHGADVAVDPSPAAFLGGQTVTVPLPEAGACASCHAIADPNDPVAPCLLGGRADLGLARPVLCLDEHRDVLVATAAGRTAAWEAARVAATRAPTVAAAEVRAPSASGAGWGTLWVGSGFAGGLLVLGGVRLVSRIRTRPRAKTELPQHAVLPAKIVRLPHINTNTCIGCHACVDACPYDVLEVHAYVAQVVRPDDCCGLTLCEQRCPNGSLVITDGEPIEDRPHMSDLLESLDSPGVFLAGDLTGLPLIRNAINQGTHVTRTIAAGLVNRGGPLHDLVIVGAGPAGMSAALEPELRYVVVEQASVAESIRSFPRGKLVFDQPLGLPLIGDLWLEKSTKEELLSKWLRIVHVQGLAIHEHHRVTAIERIHGGPPTGHLRVHLLTPQGQATAIDTRRVLLAFGRRGSPRKLPVEIPEAAQSTVHYSLADARSFANQRVVITGLGDVAMEAAIAIAKQPGTTVTICYRGDGFRRGKTRNIDEIKRLAHTGRLQLALSTDITDVQPGRITLRGPNGATEVPCDALFVMIGTIAPWQFLDACGVRRVAHAPTPAAPPPPTGP